MLHIVDRLGKISSSQAEHMKEEIRSEILAIKEAGDKDREAHELNLIRRLNDSKRDRIHNLVIIVHLQSPGTRWPCGTVPDMRSQGRGFEHRPYIAAVYQRQLSVPSLRGRLMSTSESRE